MNRHLGDSVMDDPSEFHNCAFQSASSPGILEWRVEEPDSTEGVIVRSMSFVVTFATLLLLAVSAGAYESPAGDSQLIHGGRANALEGTTAELEPGAFVEDSDEIASIAERYGVSESEAREISRFEQGPVIRVGDALYKEFAPDIVTTEADSPRRLLIVYVSGNRPAIETRAQSLMGSDGRVEVRDGFLSLEEVKTHWRRVENALTDAGLTVTGGLGPNEIDVWVDDIERAQEIISSLDLPAPLKITITYSAGFSP